MKIKIIEIYDICYCYIKYILLHKWNKLTPEHFKLIEESGWVADSRLR